MTSDSPIEIDLLILGAGPAGCAAALRARQSGLRVFIADTCSGPKNSPGETLHPGVEPLLQQLGIAEKFLQANFARHQGIWIDTYGTQHFSAYGKDQRGPWRGFQADRKVLGELLQQAVIESGATLMRKARPQELLTNQNTVTGAVINGQIIHAAWTIDASGRNAWLAQALQLPTEIHSPPLHVKFGWHDHPLPELAGQPRFRFNVQGWHWQAPINSNRTAWVELRIGDKSDCATGMNVSWQRRPESVGPGFILVGDTAISFDPSSSHGVLRALMSGIMCSHLLDGLFNQKISQEMLIQTYREWINTQFFREKNTLLRFYLDSPAGAEFLTRMNAP